MGLIRTFRGRVVKRTLRHGDTITVFYQGPVKGRTGSYEQVPFAEYERGVCKSVPIESVPVPIVAAPRQ